MVVFRSLSLLVLMTAPAAVLAADPAEPHPSCRLGAELRQRLAELDPENSSCGKDAECWQEREQAARALLAENKGNLWAAQLVQKHELLAAQAAFAEDALLERYRQAAAAAPEDSAAQYLWGRLAATLGQGTAGLEKALALDGSPAARLALAQAKLKAEPSDEKNAGGLVGSFLAACPARASEVLPLTLHWPQAPFWLPEIERLRAGLRQRPALEQALLLRMIWSLDFKQRLAAEHAAQRQRVAAEVDLFEKLALRSSPVYWTALRIGHDASGRDAEVIARRRAEAFPCENGAIRLAKADFGAKIGIPEDAAEWAQTPEQNRQLVAFHRELALRCPRDPVRWVDIFHLLVEDPDTPPGELAALARKAAEGLSAQREPPWSAQRAEMLRDMARALLDRRIAPAEAQELLAASRQGFERFQAFRLSPQGPPVTPLVKTFMDSDELTQRLLEARVLAQLGELAQATARLEAAQALASEIAKRDPQTAAEKTIAEKGVAAYGAARQELLALAPQSPLPPELAAAAGRAAGAIAWLPVDRDLAGLPFEDSRGRLWQKAELGGKTWLINLWATWCGPCMAELPHIQKLYEELKDRPDVGVLTLNFDMQVGKVQPFLDRKGYTFPALLASEKLKETTEQGIPQNWLVDRNLRVRRKAQGFDPDHAEAFLAEIKAGLESLKAP